MDTPGQIEIFTWSASGQLISEAFAATFPTVLLYVVDTPRCMNPQTFMANMLQAVSILYKMRLPLVLVFNKVDVTKHAFALEWMKDFEVFQAALQDCSGYSTDLSRSLSLVLDEFYSNLRAVGVSAMTGEGVEDLLDAIGSAAEEYRAEYLPQLQERRRAAAAEAEARRLESIERFKEDYLKSGGDAPVALGKGARRGGGGGGGGGAEGLIEEGDEEEDEDD